MHPSRKFLLSYLLLSCLTQPSLAQPTSSQANQQVVDLLVQNVSVLIGDGTETFKGYVAVENDRFIAVEYGSNPQYEGRTEIDGEGMFLVPGLWDAHVHMRSSTEEGLDARNFLAAGVTSVIDMGGFTDRLKSLELSLDSDMSRGPTLYPSYFMLNGESFAGFQRAVTSESEVVTAIDELSDAGARQIKVHRALDPSLLRVVVEYAQSKSLTVTGHIPLGMHPLEACQTGMQSVQHVGSFVEALQSAQEDDFGGMGDAISYLLSEDAGPLYECMRQKNMSVTPTLVVYQAIAERRTGGGELLPAYQQFIADMQSIALKFHSEGITLLAGTDTSDIDVGFSLAPGVALLAELTLLEEAGISPLDVLSMATINPPTVMGVQKLTGSIAVGSIADFLLLSEDPGESTAALASVVSIFKHGEQLD